MASDVFTLCHYAYYCYYLIYCYYLPSVKYPGEAFHHANQKDQQNFQERNLSSGPKNPFWLTYRTVELYKVKRVLERFFGICVLLTYRYTSYSSYFILIKVDKDFYSLCLTNY